ncbi:MAG TPA: Ig-like domain-containing protein, partial [Solirubrobacteraceae bacterium]
MLGSQRLTDYLIDQEPQHGSVSLSGQTATYVPDAGFGGTDTFTYSGHSVDGESAPQTVTVTVNAPAADAASPTGLKPEVSVTNPVSNAAYLWGSVPSAQFTCAPGTGGTLSSCTATGDGQSIVNGQALPSGVGTHAMTITATDADGMTSVVALTYTVSSAINPPPPVSIGAPVQGASYRLGQSVRARYSCLASSHAPALQACVGSVATGRAINTGTLGTHTFSVSATNAEGESSTETAAYTVVPTTNRFSASRPKADVHGNIRFTLR